MFFALAFTLFASDASSMIIYAGGTTPEQGQAALAEYNELKTLFEPVATLGDGFPKVLESSKVEGLKPGFFVVVLGVCAASDKTLDFYKAVDPRIYARPVTWTEPVSCPKLVQDWGSPARADVKTKDGTLSVASFAVAGPNESIESLRGAPGVDIVLLRDASGKLLFKEVLPGTGCTLSALTKSGSDIVATSSCTGECCTVCRGERVTMRYQAKDGKVTHTSKTKELTTGPICD